MSNRIFLTIITLLFFETVFAQQVSGWTWISGSNSINQNGTYGTKGIPSSLNTPGSRTRPVSWTDSYRLETSKESSDNLWLFGGYGYDSTGNHGYLNDLWKFNGVNWTWISGSNTINQLGTYGTKGVASSSNVPGARTIPVSWADANNNFWLFGGWGFDAITYGHLNDLWKFNGVNWTWVSGSNTGNQTGNWGTKGVASSSNVPGGRSGPVSWIDSNDNLWLFGGYGYDSTFDWGYFNDLWKFNGVNWTWVSGSNLINQNGNYGTQGIASPSNVPGARINSVPFIDYNNNLWLFGGSGYPATGFSGNLNDLWKFNGVNWTWVSGSNSTYQNGNYGTQGIASPSNVPGARVVATSWIDSNNNFWLFGGVGYPATGTVGNLNDLWKFKNILN